MRSPPGILGRLEPPASAPDMTIRKVWIIEGCISCNLCQDLVPEVFEVPPGSTSQVKKGHEKLLKGGAALDERIQEAVDSCPVEVIKIHQS